MVFLFFKGSGLGRDFILEVGGQTLSGALGFGETLERT